MKLPFALDHQEILVMSPQPTFIYLYPATNVLYEENVITNPGTEWTTVTSVFTPATDEEGKNITTQSAEKLGNEEKNVHGYDDYYSENNGFSGGSAYKATLDASKTATEFGKPLTFEFTGNGFDLIFRVRTSNRRSPCQSL